MKNVYSIAQACKDYIEFASENSIQEDNKVHVENITLKQAIVTGLKSEAKELTRELISKKTPLEIVDLHIIPALNEVGENYEKGKTFLPQLLMSAETATVSFEVVREYIKSEETTNKGKIVIATVKGDVHDIGKNIVKVILQNYGYQVFDLGKDVPPCAVLQAIKETDCKLVGLSALMTTTLPAMEETIKLIKENAPNVNIMVGGAVLTAEYAQKIGADKYAKDAMEAVRYAQKIF